jgi:signal transduction histidine kinase
MAFRRVFEILQVYDSNSKIVTGLLSSWTGVLISVIMLISLIFIKRIFDIQKQMDNLRKQNERKVLSAILRTEEKERQHFSKELHDGLGPILSSVKMAISTSRYKNNLNLLENAENLIDDSIKTLKNISNKLSPHILVNYGLIKAIKSFIAKLNVLEEPRINLSCNIENQRFSFNIEVVLYRVVCELISNTLKHAKAKNVYIDLLANETQLSINYIDDGTGFDTDKAQKELRGMGYPNIQSRVKSLDGTFDFFSKPDEGVRVKIQIPLK